jgi:gamma-glutamyl hercynylcysteine S-oxide synthase
MNAAVSLSRSLSPLEHLSARLHSARRNTDELFGIIKPQFLYERPIPERHRLIFYLGHLEAFDWNLLHERAFSIPSFHPEYDRLFAFGIDPVDGGLPTDSPADWPSRDEIQSYNSQVRTRIDEAIENAQQKSSSNNDLHLLLETAIEHRLMHAETLTYLLHRMPAQKKIAPPYRSLPFQSLAKLHSVEIPAGRASLGLKTETGQEFGWDNEFAAHSVEVPAFSIDNLNVTNARFLQFVQAGGYENDSLWTPEAREWKRRENVHHPAFWHRNEISSSDPWLYRTMFNDVPLPMHWPVYVSHAEATAYANWLGKKLPTEAQFHRAAYGTPGSDSERSFPWGENLPAPKFGNFDFNFWDPLPVASIPLNSSAFGIYDLVGNGWEWTCTPFAPFAGFEPRPFYPGYSADFFDGKHFVLKGGSPRTAASMLRRSFRNWFQPHYPYVYATFRCVEESLC